MITRSIVAPLDGSDHALVALPVAQRLARLEDATLHLVHVARETARPAELVGRIGLSESELQGRVLHAKAGEPTAEILRAATELGAIFIVLCTHTSVLAMGERIIGRTAQGVLQGASCPVVLVRPERGVVPWKLRRVLLPHDGTPTTTAAIRPAVELAQRSGAALDVLHVASLGSDEAVECGALTTPRYIDQPQHEWPVWTEEFLGRVARMCPSESERLELGMTLAGGAPGEAILSYAAEHATDLIVLVWHGAWGTERATTIKTVISNAPCPVVITRALA